jgi:hypothetical protein
MRSNAHTYPQRKVTYQTYNAQALTQAPRFVCTGVRLIHKTQCARHWLFAALLQWLKSVRAHQTSLDQLLGVGIRLAQAAPGVLQSLLAGIKLPIHALLHRLHVARQAKRSPYLARVGM